MNHIFQGLIVINSMARNSAMKLGNIISMFTRIFTEKIFLKTKNVKIS